MISSVNISLQIWQFSLWKKYVFKIFAILQERNKQEEEREEQLPEFNGG